MPLGTNWLDLSSTSNKYLQMYVKGFLDISGGNLILRNNNFFVQGGDSSLNGNLFVASNSILNGDVSLNSRLFLGSDASFGRNLFVLNKSVLGNDVSMNSRLFVNGDVSMNGNSYVANSFLLNGDASMNARLFVNGDVSMNGNLFVNNNAILDGDTSMNYRLYVGGDVSMNSRLFVAGDVSMNSRVLIGGDVSMNGNLFVNNNAILDGDTSLIYRVFIGGDVSINSRVFIGGDVSMNGNLFVNNNAILDGDTSLIYRLFVGGDASMSGNLYIANKSILNADVSMNNNLFVGSDLSVNGRIFGSYANSSIPSSAIIGGVVSSPVFNADVSVNQRLFVNNDASFNNRIFVGGDLSVNGRIFATYPSNSIPAAAIIGGVGGGGGGSTFTTDISTTQRLFITGDASFQSKLWVNGNVTFGNLNVTGTLTAPGFTGGSGGGAAYISLTGARTDVVSFDADNYELTTYNSTPTSSSVDLSMGSRLLINASGQSYFTGDLSLGMRLLVGYNSPQNNVPLQIGSLPSATNVYTSLIGSYGTNFLEMIPAINANATGHGLVKSGDSALLYSNNGLSALSNSSKGLVLGPYGSLTNGVRIDCSNVIIGCDLSVNGRLFLSTGTLASTDFTTDVSCAARLFVKSDTSMNGNLVVQKAGIFNTDLSVNSRVFFPVGSISPNALSGATIVRNDYISYDVDGFENQYNYTGGYVVSITPLNVTSDISCGNRLFVGRDVSLNGNVYLGNFVGIGSKPTSPYKLFIYNGVQHFYSDTSTNVNQIQFNSSIGTKYTIQQVDNAGLNFFRIGRDGYSDITCLSNGNVGINNSAPAYPLDVNGNMNVAGTMVSSNMFAYRNRIINGDMAIAQRATTASGLTSNTYNTVDRWNQYVAQNGGSGNFKSDQITLATSDTPYRYGFVYSQRLTVQTGAAQNIAFIQQSIEGGYVKDLGWSNSNGSSMTLSFWMRSNVATNSVFCVTIKHMNGPSTINYTYNSQFTYTVASANWQFVTITIPPPPGLLGMTTGNSVGLIVQLFTYWGQDGTNNTWLTTNTNGVSGSTAWTTTTNNYVECTGVQFEKGTVATPFEFRMNELQLCQRYYQVYGGSCSFQRFGQGYATNATTTTIMIPIYTPLRAVPTELSFNTLSNLYLHNGVTAYPVTSVASDQKASDTYSTLNVTTSGTLTTPQGFYLYVSSTYNTKLYMNAEL